MAQAKRAPGIGLRAGGKAPVTASALALANQKALERQAMALDKAAQAAVQGVSTRKRLLSKAGASEALEKLYNKAVDKNSRVHVATVDGIGNIVGVISFESINWLLRKLEKIWPGFAENSDYWQSLPHVVIGMIVYWVELLTRKQDARGLRIFPSMPREIAHEWSKAFALLGATNLWRALRVRRKDTKSMLEQIAALQAEVAGLNKRLEDQAQQPQK